MHPTDSIHWFWKQVKEFFFVNFSCGQGDDKWLTPRSLISREGFDAPNNIRLEKNSTHVRFIGCFVLLRHEVETVEKTWHCCRYDGTVANMMALLPIWWDCCQHEQPDTKNILLELRIIRNLGGYYWAVRLLHELWTRSGTGKTQLQIRILQGLQDELHRNFDVTNSQVSLCVHAHCTVHHSEFGCYQD